MDHYKLTYLEMFEAYNALSDLPTALPKQFAQELAAKGYGYATETGFTFTTPYMLTRRHLYHYHRTNQALPTLEEHRATFELGWPYNCRKILRGARRWATHGLALGMLLLAVAVSQRPCRPDSTAPLCKLPRVPLPGFYPTFPRGR